MYLERKHPPTQKERALAWAREEMKKIQPHEGDEFTRAAMALLKKRLAGEELADEEAAFEALCEQNKRLGERYAGIIENAVQRAGFMSNFAFAQAAVETTRGFP